MPAKDLRIADLHPSYRNVSYEEALFMAWLGAKLYKMNKENSPNPPKVTKQTSPHPDKQ